MKSIDFSKPGGFPLTQDELDYLQQAYTEGTLALASLGGSGAVPTILSGMVITSPVPGLAVVTDGWFLYNGDLIRFIGSTAGSAGTDVALVTIDVSAASLTYNSGVAYPSVLDKTATLTSGPSVTDSTHFPLSALQPFQLPFGLSGREAVWNPLIVNTPAGLGGVTGTVYYKKNWLNNTVHIRALLSANNAQNFTASPTATFYNMGTLPAAYIPANTAYFTAHYAFSTLIKDDLGVSWVKHLTAAINITGQVSINFIRPDPSILGYGIVFNTILPLD